MGWGPLSSQRSPKITGKGQPGLLSKLFFSYFVVFYFFSFYCLYLPLPGRTSLPALLAVLIYYSTGCLRSSSVIVKVEQSEYFPVTIVVQES